MFFWRFWQLSSTFGLVQVTMKKMKSAAFLTDSSRDSFIISHLSDESEALATAEWVLFSISCSLETEEVWIRTSLLAWGSSLLGPALLHITHQLQYPHFLYRSQCKEVATETHDGRCIYCRSVEGTGETNFSPHFFPRPLSDIRLFVSSSSLNTKVLVYSKANESFMD